MKRLESLIQGLGWIYGTYRWDDEPPFFLMAIGTSKKTSTSFEIIAAGRAFYIARDPEQ